MTDLPLIIGVAGHRRIRAADRNWHEDQLRNMLRDLVPASTPVIRYAMTSLAEGADRLFARIALQEGWRLICPLPFPIAEFRKTFSEADAEFDELLASAEDVFVVPELTGDPYVDAAHYIASRSHILVAFWDGAPFKDHAKLGGTGHSVAMREGPMYTAVNLRSAGDSIGPTYWIHAPQEEGLQLHRSSWRPMFTQESPEEYARQLVRRTAEFSMNARAKSSDNDSDELIEETLNSVQPTPTSETRLARLFCHATLASTKSQRHKVNSLSCSIWLIAFGSVSNTILALIPGQFWLVSGLALSSLTLVVATYRINKLNQERAHEHHVDYRALAESLRIGIALRLSGITEAPTRLVPIQFWGTDSWLSDTVTALWATLPAADSDVDYAWKTWIQGQVDYLRDKRLKIDRTMRKIDLFTSVPFGVAALLGVLSTGVAFSTKEQIPVSQIVSSGGVLLALLGLAGTALAAARQYGARNTVWGAAGACFLVLCGASLLSSNGAVQASSLLALLGASITLCILVVGGVSFYASKLSFQEDRARYVALESLYAHAATFAERPDLTPEIRQRIVHDLAQEAMTELATWMNMARRKAPEVMSA